MYSINELKRMNVTQAVAFGPQLIIDGKNMVTDQVEEAFGWAPRTGIGQDTEGNVFMIVTGGGSTTMIYKGKLQLKPATETSVGMRYLPNAFVVIPKE